MFNKPNFKRMLELIDEVFAARNDPDQLQVNEQVRRKLLKIHPATLSEYADENGPAVWVLLIPTTAPVMEDFLSGKISEREILDKTPADIPYGSIYLCSATALPEYRGKGITKELTLEAVNKIRKDHKIKALFVWAFSKEGSQLAGKIAEACGLPLREK